MKNKISLGSYIAFIIKYFYSIFYQNLFSIDSFTYIEDDLDIDVTYCVTGKRKPILRKKITHLIKDKKKMACFSREDVCEIGIFYGRIMERKLKNRNIENLEKKIFHLTEELNKLK